MASPLVHAGATVTCAHGGPANVLATTSRVLVGGRPVATTSTVCVIAACPARPQPCTTGRWSPDSAGRVLVGGEPLVTSATGSVTEPAALPLVVVDVDGRVLAS